MDADVDGKVSEGEWRRQYERRATDGRRVKNCRHRWTPTARRVRESCADNSAAASWMVRHCKLPTLMEAIINGKASEPERHHLDHRATDGSCCLSPSTSPSTSSVTSMGAVVHGNASEAEQHRQLDCHAGNRTILRQGTWWYHRANASWIWQQRQPV